MRKTIYLLLFLSGFTTNCVLQPIDPAILSDIDANLFSLPAELTQGRIDIKLAKYQTRGTIDASGSGEGQRVASDTDIYDPDDPVLFQTVGSEIQLYKIRTSQADEAYTIYQPRYVISGAQRAEDITSRKNIVIVSILTGKIDEIGFPADDVIEADTDGIQAKLEAAYCTLPDAHTELGVNYPRCRMSLFFESTSTTAKTMTSTGVELFSDADDTAQADAREFDVVMEFIDGERTIFTTIFPYSPGFSDEDFTDVFSNGNHTNARLTVQNFPDLDPGDDGYSTNDINDDIFGTRIATHQPDINSDIEDSANCTAFYTDPDTSTQDPDDFLYGKGECPELIELLNNPSVLKANGGQSSQRNDLKHCDDKSGAGKTDFVCLHIMQEAGREHKAEGTDADPLDEFAILGLEFSVVRAPTKTIEEN